MTPIQPTPDGTGDYLRIRIGRTLFLVQTGETPRIQRAPGAGSSPADELPVLRIDESLRPAAPGADPDTCRVVVGSRTGPVAIACDAADIVAAEGMKLYALPRCMIGPESVFSAAATLGDNIHGVCRAEDLLAALGVAARTEPDRTGDTP